MVKIFMEAARLLFSGLIPPWLWLILFAQTCSLVFVLIPDMNQSNLTLIALAAAVSLGLMIWSGWELSRILGRARPDDIGSFSGWFFWVFVFGLCTSVPIDVIELWDNDNFPVWLSPVIAAVIGAMALPLLVHAVKRSTSGQNVAIIDTIRNLRPFTQDLRSAHFFWLLLTGLVIPLSVVYLDTSAVSNIGAWAVGLSVAAGSISSIGSFAIAAIGHQKIENITTDVTDDRDNFRP